MQKTAFYNALSIKALQRQASNVRQQRGNRPPYDGETKAEKLPDKP